MLIFADKHWLPFFLRDRDRDNLLSEASILLGGDGSLMAAQSVAVLLLAADTIALGNVLRRLAHAVGVVHSGELGVDETPAQGGIVEGGIAAKGALGLAQDEGGARHALDTASDKSIAGADLDRLRGAVNGLQARTTEPVDGLACYMDRQACQQ